MMQVFLTIHTIDVKMRYLKICQLKERSYKTNHKIFRNMDKKYYLKVLLIKSTTFFFFFIFLLKSLQLMLNLHDSIQ